MKMTDTDTGTVKNNIFTVARTVLLAFIYPFTYLGCQYLMYYGWWFLVIPAVLTLSIIYYFVVSRPTEYEREHRNSFFNRKRIFALSHLLGFILFEVLAMLGYRELLIYIELSVITLILYYLGVLLGEELFKTFLFFTEVIFRR